jgi:hypothetical protein
MVEISLLVEGGVSANSNDSADTFDNSVRLRESFHKLLNAGVEKKEMIQLRIDTKGSYTAIIKEAFSPTTLALLDLDAHDSQRQQRIKEYKLEAYQDLVFFMIQTMETWILSQPDAIEKSFSSLKVNPVPLAEDARIKDVDLTTIPEPHQVLDKLLKDYFQYEKGEKLKQLKYGKLKNSHVLLEQLDIHRLKEQFIDVKNLLNKINELTIYA